MGGYKYGNQVGGSVKVDTSTLATKTEVASVDNRVTNLVINNGSSTAEVLDSRIDLVGVTHPLLKDRLNADIKKGVPIQTLKEKKSSTKTNDYSGILTGSKTFTSQNSTYEYIDTPTDAPFLASEVPKVLRMNVNATGAGSATLIHSVSNISNGFKFVVGAWFRKSDLLNMPAGEFEPYFIAKDSGGASLGAGAPGRVPYSQIVVPGYKKTGTVLSTGYVIETHATFDDWVYISFSVSPLAMPTLTEVAVYFPRVAGLSAGNTGKIETIGNTLLRNETEISPAVLYKGLNASNTATSKWAGKHWITFGDSNTQTIANSVKYHDYIRDKIGCRVTNYALGGTGYIVGTSPIYNKIGLATTDADLITVMGGGNDWQDQVPLGVMGDKTTATFYGALDHTMNLLINKYPTKTIAVFTQMRRANEGTGNSIGVTVEQQVYATIEVCKKYSIPVLDLYHHGNMYTWNTDYVAQCIPDGVHLNDFGQLKLSSKIQAFIESL